MRAAIVLSGAALLCRPSASNAQQLIPDRTDGRCACRIVLDRIATLGSSRDSVAQANTYIARDSKGRYYVGPTSKVTEIAVYEPSGAASRLIGVESGPAQLTYVQHVRISRGDSLLVLDAGRIALFAPSGRFVRSKRLPANILSFRFIQMPDGRVVINNFFPGNLSYALLSPQFEILRTFGVKTPLDNPRDDEQLQYLIAPMDSARFVAVKQNRNLVIEIWDTTGSLVQRFAQHPDWFPPWTFADALALGPRSDALPRVTGAFVDELQRLWIIAAVPDPKRTTSIPKWRAERGREIPYLPLPVTEYEGYFDTIIEVVNLTDGRVVATQRLDAYVPKVMEGGLLYGLRASNNSLTIEIWRPKIVR